MTEKLTNLKYLIIKNKHSKPRKQYSLEKRQNTNTYKVMATFALIFSTMIGIQFLN